MDDVFRFKVRRAFRLGRKILPGGSLIPLKLAYDVLPDIFSLGLLEELPQEGESKWVGSLVDYKGWIRGEIIDKTDIPEWPSLKRRGWVVELYDRDITSEHVCGGCPKSFVIWEAAIRHRQTTGHKRPYSRRKKEKKLDQVEENM